MYDRERIAETLYEQEMGKIAHTDWRNASELVREYYLEDADAVIRYLNKVTVVND